MARPLSEYFQSVEAFDLYKYGYGQQGDFLSYPFEHGTHDWVITNPPFRQAGPFVQRALSVARKGVAILARTVFLESMGRYRDIFCQEPPTKFAQFVERVPMVKGRLSRTATTATSYAWFIWEKRQTQSPPLLSWIPPCRAELERREDYPD